MNRFMTSFSLQSNRERPHRNPWRPLPPETAALSPRAQIALLAGNRRTLRQSLPVGISPTPAATSTARRRRNTIIAYERRVAKDCIAAAKHCSEAAAAWAAANRNKTDAALVRAEAARDRANAVECFDQGKDYLEVAKKVPRRRRQGPCRRSPRPHLRRG